MSPELSIDPVRERGKSKAAIVFVHGFGGDIRDTWARFPEFVAGEAALADWDIWLLGYSTKLRLDLLGIWAGDPGLHTLALRLQTDALRGELKPYSALCFVAHSMGGLVVQRALLDNSRLRQRTSHVVLYGTPSDGLIKAGLAKWLKPQFAHMAADSPFIRDLRHDWSGTFGPPQPLPFRFVAVAGERDEFVPATSALGPFRQSGNDLVAVVPGNHIEMVKPGRAQDPCVRLLVNLLTQNAAPAGPRNAARVAVELGMFQSAIATLLPNAAELDPSARIQLAIALDSVGRRDEAIEVLEVDAGSHTDAMGTLAGRYKRRWLAGRMQRDGAGAMAWYQRGYDRSVQAGDHAQSYYHGINLAFMQRLFRNDAQAAHAVALRVLEHCAAVHAHPETPEHRRWRVATEGEARLLLGDPALALTHYREAVSGHPPPWQVASMHQQAQWVAGQLYEAEVIEGLERLFTSHTDAAPRPV